MRLTLRVLFAMIAPFLGMVLAPSLAPAPEYLAPGVYVEETSFSRASAAAKARKRWEAEMRQALLKRARRDAKGRAIRSDDIALSRAMVKQNCAPNPSAKSARDAWRCSAETDRSRDWYVMIEVEQE